MENLIAFLLFAVSTTFTPGPNNIMIMNSGMNFGLQKSMPHYLGICLGFPAMILMVALGMGSLFIQYTWIQQVLKTFGSLYMLYLAWQILRSTSKSKYGKPSRPITFVQAVLFQWVNPKAWLVTISTISLFTVPSHLLLNAVIISMIYFLVCLPCVGVWFIFGNYLQKILKKESHQIFFNICMAVLLLIAIVIIILD